MNFRLLNKLVFMAFCGCFVLATPTAVFAEFLDGYGLTLRLADSIPTHSFKIKEGVAFKTNSRGSLGEDRTPSWPLVAYFPKTAFNKYFFGGFTMNGGFSTSHYSLEDDAGSQYQLTNGEVYQPANDAGSRYLTANEKTAYCKDDVIGLYDLVDITPNPCSLSIGFSETNVSFGYQLGFSGFGENRIKWLEFAVSGSYMLLSYSLDVNVCISERSDINSVRFKSDGACLREAAKVDSVSGTTELFSYGMSLNLIRFLASNSILSFFEFGILGAPEFEISLKDHNPFVFEYTTNYMNIFTYTLVF